MNNASDIITVTWFDDRGEVKGKDQCGKMVFIDRSFGGRPPRPGTTTDARATYDAEKDPRAGGKRFFRAIPLSPQDPTALPEEAAKARMLELILAGGPRLGDSYIEVNLPGWVGALEGRFPKTRDRGPLGMSWWYRGQDDGRRMSVYNTRSFLVHVTDGIFMEPSGFKIVNWNQAVRDLGEPVTVEPNDHGTAWVTWSDEHGGELRAEISRETAIRHGCTYTNLRLGPTHYPDVCAKVTLLSGRWVMKGDESLAIGEWGTDPIQPAQFEGRYARALPPEVRAQVVALLRTTLHSAAWHKQHSLSRELSVEAKYKQAIWERIRKLEKLLADPLTPNFRYEEALRDINNERDKIGLHLAKSDSSFEGVLDPVIYGEGTPDDFAEIKSLAAANLEAITTVDTKIEELSAMVAAAVDGRHSVDLSIQARAEADKLNDEIRQVEDQARLVSDHFLARTCHRIGSARRSVEVIMERLRDRSSIDVVLEAVDRARTEVQRQLEWVREQLGH